MSRAKRVFLIVLSVIASVCVLFGVVLGIYSAYQNKTIRVSAYTVTHEDIPASFDGKRIVQLTDLHNKDFGDGLTALVASLKPDIIVITGDWIGKTDADITIAKEQASALCGVAPIYYVTGNHEAQSPCWDELGRHLISCGVKVLKNKATYWEENDEKIQLVGMYDPEFSTHLWRDFAPLAEDELYTVFLFHRPEYFEQAAGYGADLILSGHTHGGQIRLPLIGAVYAPNQGWFPRYDVGRFDIEGATMIVGQGLGESVYFRILTPPEVVVVDLKTKE